MGEVRVFAGQGSTGSGSRALWVRPGRRFGRRGENGGGTDPATGRERFEGGEKNADIHAELRVIMRSVERRRRAGCEDGAAAAASHGSPGRPKLSDAQVARLENELQRGPPAYGRKDRRWPLARVKTLIWRLFRVTCAVEGTWALLRRHGWSWRQPARPWSATTRSSRCGSKEAWPRVKAPRRPAGPESLPPDGAGSANGTKRSTRRTGVFTSLNDYTGSNPVDPGRKRCALAVVVVEGELPRPVFRSSRGDCEEGLRRTRGDAAGTRSGSCFDG